MNRTLFLNNPTSSGRQLLLPTLLRLGWVLLLAMGFFLAAHAATNDGTELKAAFDAMDGLVNGYGKQLLVLIGFALTAMGYFATNTSSVVMKFVGYAIYLGTALGAAVTLTGTLI